jgi:hypothetical protein
LALDLASSTRPRRTKAAVAKYCGTLKFGFAREALLAALAASTHSPAKKCA